MNPNFENYLLRVAFLVPVLIAAIGGIVWAVLNWKKASTPAMATTIACAVLLVFTCIFPALMIWVPQMMMPRQPINVRPGDDPFFAPRWTGRGLEVCSHACTALCIGGLVFAAFANRAAESKKKRDAKRRRDVEGDEDEG